MSDTRITAVNQTDQVLDLLEFSGWRQTIREISSLNPRISGPAQFKSVLFKGQLEFPLVLGNLILQRVDLTYMQIFICVVGGHPNPQIVQRSTVYKYVKL